MAKHWLDITTTALGLAYILLEYKASVWMWVVGFFMQSLGIVLYYQKGLYADCGMEFYYLAMTVYGFIAWMRHKQKAKELPIRHIPKKMALLWVLVAAVVWALIYFVLSRFTITCGLYFYKDIPFKAGLYGLYVIIAVFGYMKWRKMMYAQGRGE